MIDQYLNKVKEAFLNLLSVRDHHVHLDSPSLNADEWNSVITLVKAHNILSLVFQKASECEGFTVLPEYQRLVFETIDELIEERHRQNMIQQEISNITGIIPSNLARFESGTIVLTLVVLQKYASALGKHIELKVCDNEEE